MSLLSGRMSSWSIPYTSQVLPPGVGLSGDTLVWTRQRWEGRGDDRSLVYGIYDRTLPSGPAQTIQEVREHIGKFIPRSYVDGYVLPRLAGNLLVWQRSRCRNDRPRTDIMAVRLPHGPVRVLAWNGAQEPATNGWKVAWLSVRGDSLDLMQLDTHTGKRKTVGQNVLSWTSSPQLGGTTLSWQSGRTGQSWRLLLVRELLTGQQYTLVSWTASGANPTPLKVVGPGAADGNRVVWQEIMRGDEQPAAYLAVARLPQRPLPPAQRSAGRCVPPPPGTRSGTTWICT